jgi:hypothetical protein
MRREGSEEGEEGEKEGEGGEEQGGREGRKRRGARRRARRTRRSKKEGEGRKVTWYFLNTVCRTPLLSLLAGFFFTLPEASCFFGESLLF